MLRQVLSDFGGHGQTKVGVDVDFANAMLGCFQNHFFRDTLSSGDVSTVLIANRYKFRQYSGGAMKHQRGIGNQRMYFFESVKIQIRVTFELVGAVAGADCDC